LNDLKNENGFLEYWNSINPIIHRSNTPAELPHQHHPPCLHESSGAQLIEIHAAGNCLAALVAAIPRDRKMIWTLPLNIKDKRKAEKLSQFITIF